MSNKKTYFITGGGTGGHIYPAVAVADALLNENDTEQIFYIGNPNNLEASIVKDKNYKFLPVISSGMPRKLNFTLLKWAFQMFGAWLKCIFYINKYKPDAIFGTGGYVSAPALLAGVVTNTPFVMHDCDANPGLVTRELSPFAKSISIAFEIAKDKLKNSNCSVNGNPIREKFKTLTKTQAKETLGLSDKLTLCIMGGSQGAKTINESAVKIIKDLSQKLDIQVIFQTGKRNFETAINEIEKIYPEYKEDKNLIIRPYFEDMVTVLKACDIAISRAGSLSISELCASNVATIFIPYPYAAQDHQRKNAKYMVENGAGLYLENSDTTPEKLFDMINSLVQDKTKMEAIQNAASKMAKFDGVQNIIKQIKSAIGSKN